MTSPDPLTRRELLELAALDVLGLLDEYEAAYYTRSYHHAPATVQDEIKRIQAEVASDESLLPDKKLDPSLRQRVLEVVAKAIERETSELAQEPDVGADAEIAEVYVVPSFKVWIDRGDATVQDVSALFDALSDLHRAAGGYGLSFQTLDSDSFVIQEADV